MQFTPLKIRHVRLKLTSIFIFCCLTLSHPTLADELPELGDYSQTVLSAAQEKDIAEQIMRDIAVSDDVVQDIEMIDYLQALGQKLVAAELGKSDATQALIPFNFFVVKDNSINAFAMPGGVIGVHTGLILAANSESELASVLGHEIGHVTQHHLARMLASQQHDTFKNIASIALALLVARANPELSGGALLTATASGVQRQLDYTREHEREADRVGLQILDHAGFDVRAMPAFFSTLQRGTRFVEGSAPGFLRTHPLTAERIADVSNRVESMPYRQVPDSLEFQMMRVKIRAAMGNAQTAVDSFKNNIAERRYANEIAEHYGLALALLRNNALAEALTQVDWLQANAGRNAMLENLNARVQIALKHPQQAANIYSKALVTFPANRGLIYGYAELLLANKQTQTALNLLVDKQNLYPNDAYFYTLSARAYSMQNKLLLQYQAQGEAYLRQYDVQKATEQLALAVKANDGNFYEKSIVEARLKQLKQQLMNEKSREKI